MCRTKRERFEAIAGARSSIQSVRRERAALGQAGRLGGRCYSGKLLPKNQTGYRREADRCHLRAHGLVELETGANASSSFFPPKEVSRESERKTVPSDLASPASFSRLSIGRPASAARPPKGELLYFPPHENWLGHAEGRKNLYGSGDRIAVGSLRTPPPSSCFLFSFLFERERERERKVAR